MQTCANRLRCLLCDFPNLVKPVLPSEWRIAAWPWSLRARFCSFWSYTRGPVFGPSVGFGFRTLPRPVFGPSPSGESDFRTPQLFVVYLVGIRSLTACFGMTWDDVNPTVFVKLFQYNDQLRTARAGPFGDLAKRGPAVPVAVRKIGQRHKNKKLGFIFWAVGPDIRQMLY